MNSKIHFFIILAEFSQSVAFRHSAIASVFQTRQRRRLHARCAVQFKTLRLTQSTGELACSIVRTIIKSYKSRSVPACAVCKNTNERFCLHMLRVFLNASLKNSEILCFNQGLSLFYVSSFLVIKKSSIYIYCIINKNTIK